ncbi:MAG: FkbM family methyltransferase [Minicystis sp.]
MSTLRAAARRVTNAILDRAGFELVRKAPPKLSFDAALARLRAAGDLQIGTVIDVGASNGDWSRMTLRHFPGARYLLVEANPVHAPALERFRAEHPRVEFVLAAAGAEAGELYFDATGDFGGVASREPTAGKCITVPVTTLDEEVRRRALPPPYFVKLDTHGFEVPILEGARETLKQASLAMIEVYNFKLVDGCLRFHEMCAFMEERGLRTIDFCDPMHRPKDGAFWQMDMLFAPADRAAFRSNTYA